MGSDHNLACVTCKVTYYLGYGSAFVIASTLEEYDKAPDRQVGTNTHKDGRPLMQKECDVNRKLRALLVEHAGHDTRWWGGDFAWVEGKDLMGEGGYDPPYVLIEGFAAFKNFDLAPS